MESQMRTTEAKQVWSEYQSTIKQKKAPNSTLADSKTRWTDPDGLWPGGIVLELLEQWKTPAFQTEAAKQAVVHLLTIRDKEPLRARLLADGIHGVEEGDWFSTPRSPMMNQEPQCQRVGNQAR